MWKVRRCYLNLKVKRDERWATIVRGVFPGRQLRVGFTLIELLVVIAIIAVLAAILFPVFSQAREKARQSQCLSNLRNIAMATYMYAQDYDERFMKHFTPCWQSLGLYIGDRPPDPWDPLMNPDWYMSVETYTKNRQIFACPTSARWTWKSMCFPSQRGRYPSGWTVAYGFNEAIFLYPDLFALPAIREPASSVTGGDNENTFHTPWSQTRDGIMRRMAFALIGAWYSGADFQCGCPATILRPDRMEQYTRHLGGSIMMFADGHAKWDRWQSIKMRRAPGGRYNFTCPEIIGRIIPATADWWRTCPKGDLGIKCW